jgi:glycosyltransferase involved in cell wall biosynthesis
VLTEALVDKGQEVTLFATGDSVSSAKHEWICPTPYGESEDLDAKVWECLHIGHLMEKADQFDIIHNHFDFLPLTYSRLIRTPVLTTIHGFSSEKIIPVYKKYNATSFYVSISNADRHPDLDYLDTVYHGIDSNRFTFRQKKGDYLLSYGRIHPEKGTHAAIEIARKCGLPLVIAGLIQNQNYYRRDIAPHLNKDQISYVGNVSQREGNELLGQAKALLHPIYFDEPFGLSVAESMMCGTPVIAFNRGSMPELIEDGKTGFLVNNIAGAAEAVARLDEIDPFYCRAHAKEKFCIQGMAERYIHIYRKITGID